MEKVIAVIRFKELDSATASDVETLIGHNKMKETAKHHAISMVLSVGGRDLGEHESDVVLEIPLEQANIIREIHSRILDDLETSTTIGVGDDLKDAKLALDWAIENRPATIKVFEPAIAQKKKTSDDNDKFDYFNPSEVAMDEEGKPVHQMQKAEAGEPEDWADDREAISDETKQKVANIVQMLQQKKGQLDALQQSNPDIYQGVVSLVQSISSITQAAKKADAKDHSKMITKIARHLDKAHNTDIKDDAAHVLEMLIEAQEQEQQKDDEEHQIRHSLANRRYKQRHKDAREFSKKSGADVKFLMNLNRTMRK